MPAKVSANVTSLKADSLCPQCGSSRVHSGAGAEGKEGLRGSNRIPLDALHYATLDNYVCLNCGYLESYISDRGALNRVAKEWPKITPKGDSE
jgi:hypothetical protein